MGQGGGNSPASTNVPIDAEKLVAARRAGMSFAELHRRAYVGEYPPSRPMDLNDLI